MGKPHKGRLTPYACFKCRKSFKRKHEVGVFERACPSCGSAAYRLMDWFKPPKADDVKQWKKVEFLYQHGFWFQSVPNAFYPKTLEEAKLFVDKYKEFALTRGKVSQWFGTAAL
jgi:DNA-directed RNA polymerase subunit RPC12/RpoP